MFLLLILLLVVIPIAEVYLIIQVGQAIGAGWTLLLLILDAVLGAQLLRWQGRTVWLRFQQALANNRMPHREIIDGVLVILGGALLMTPGFLTDVFGLILLIPPTRVFVRKIGLKFFTPATVARVMFVRPRSAPREDPLRLGISTSPHPRGCLPDEQRQPGERQDG